MKLVTSISILTLLFHAPSLRAQVLDPATASLLGPRSSSGSSETLDDGRFKVTPIKNPPKASAATKKKRSIATADTTKAEAKSAPANNTAPASTDKPTPAESPTGKHSLSDQVKILILGDDEDIEDFHKSLHPDDRRNNFLEISVAPTYIYDSSTSNYSFRNLTTQSPGFTAGADIWASPFFGIHGQYVASLGQNVMSPAAKQMVPSTYQDLEIGLRFRKHFGLKRKSPSLTWGLDFVDRTNHVPGNTTDRVSTSTSGLSLSLQADIPRNSFYSHFVGLEVQPFLAHQESSNSNVHSGGKNDTYEIGAWIGGTWLFDRGHQLFWKLQERIEQNSFNGSATAVDPSTGSTPNGVSVTNCMTFFSVGYRWGN